MSSPIPKIFYALLFLLLVSLTGCASIFDAPYEELPEEAEIQSTEELVAFEPDKSLHELLASAVEPERVVSYDNLWERIRAGFAVETLDNDPQVNRVAKRFAEMRFLERVAQRASGHLYYVVEQTDQRRLPMELVLVPFVESGYTLEARSDAQANGAWQFIERTARTYELTIDRFRDDRLSLISSTRAGLDYLADLYLMFNDWTLAMAAYNVGEKRIQAEIDAAKARGIKYPSFKDLASRLPQETRDYVPRILALKKLINNPALYKVTLPPIENAPRFSVVEIHRNIDLTLAARLAGISAAEFAAYNPSMRTPVIMGSSHAQILLPHAAALRLIKKMGEHQGPWVSWRTVRVTRTTTPAEIARRHNVAARIIVQVNPLAEGQNYLPGSTLLLPIKGSSAGIES